MGYRVVTGSEMDGAHFVQEDLGNGRGGPEKEPKEFVVDLIVRRVGAVVEIELSPMICLHFGSDNGQIGVGFVQQHVEFEKDAAVLGCVLEGEKVGDGPVEGVGDKEFFEGTRSGPPNEKDPSGLLGNPQQQGNGFQPVRRPAAVWILPNALQNQEFVVLPVVGCQRCELLGVPRKVILDPHWQCRRFH